MSEPIEPVLLLGDCVETMRGMEPNSVDAVVTDPPSGISFMGREWDTYSRAAFIAFMRQVMDECLRVLKPGGHALVWAIPRTSHWTATAVEDAGFEIRDVCVHIFGSGFPKSLSVSAAIEKTALADEATKWSGFGTALKPATEHWILARKPLKSTVAHNVVTYGTGALNIDGCRVGWGAGGDASEARRAAGYTEAAKKALGGVVASESETGFTGEVKGADSSLGRWPSNLLLSHSPECELVGTKQIKAITGTSAGRMNPGWSSDVYGTYAGDPEKAGAPTGYGDADGMETVEEWRCAEGCPVAELDAQSGSVGSFLSADADYAAGEEANVYGTRTPHRTFSYGDEGGASRFFPTFKYQAKPSRAERNAGLEGHATDTEQSSLVRPKVANTHPTVKSTALMSWLVRLVTPPSGTVLDPFMGSGSTGIACVKEGFGFIGIEREADYMEIAKARIAHAVKEKDAEPIPLALEWAPEPKARPAAPPPSATLF